jgi:hypothetical protein
MKLHRREDLRAEAAKAPGFEEAYEQVGRELSEELVEYHLAELRQLRQVTHVEVARQIGVSQPGLSALEKRGDVQLSTLRDFVQGLGGHLELTAVFDGDVREPLVLDRPAPARPCGRADVRTCGRADVRTCGRRLLRRKTSQSRRPSGRTADIDAGEERRMNVVQELRLTSPVFDQHGVREEAGT